MNEKLQAQMKLKVGQEITLIDAPMGATRSQKRTILQIVEGGVLVPAYPPTVQPPSFRLVVFVPFSNIEEPPRPKAIPGRVYKRDTGAGLGFYICRENGRLAFTGALTTASRDVDYNPDTDTEVEVG